MIFYYKGVDSSKKIKRGIINAGNKKEAIIELKKQDIRVLIDIEKKADIQLVNKIRSQLYPKMAELENKASDKKREDKKSFLKEPEGLKDIRDKISNFKVFNKKKNTDDRDEDIESLEKALESVFKTDDNSKNMYFKSKVYSKIQKIIGKEEFDELADGDVIDYSNKDRSLDVDFVSDDKINWDLIEIRNIKRLKPKKKVKVKSQEIVIFTKRLRIMYMSGIQIPEALDILSETENEQMRTMVLSLLEDVTNGETLANAMSRFPKQFNSTYIALIAIGEEKGVLSSVLGDIVKFMEQDIKVKKKIKNASIYPSIVLVVVILVLFLGSKYMIPQFKEIITDMLGNNNDFEMPRITAIVFGLSERLPEVIGGIVLAFIGFNVLRRRVKIVDNVYRAIRDKIVLKIPKINKVFISSYMYTISSNIALLVKANVQEVEAVNFAKDAVNNVYIKNDLALVSHLMTKEALPLSESLKLQKNMDELLYGMAKTAEVSGSTGKALDEAANYYSDELSSRIADLMELIQPLSIVLIAAIVFPTVLAIFIPMIRLQAAMIA